MQQSVKHDAPSLFYVVALCTAQALLFDLCAPELRQSLLSVQCLAQCACSGMKRTSGSTILAVLTQSALFAASLLLPVAADRYNNLALVNGNRSLAKTLAPFFVLAAERRSTTVRQWVFAIISYVAFSVATDAVFELRYTGRDALCAYALLLTSTASGVALGYAQRYFACGPCWSEMAVLSFLIILLTDTVTVPDATARNAITIALYSVLSVAVHWSIQQFSRATQHCPQKLTQALTLRRVATVFIHRARLRPINWLQLVAASIAFAAAHNTL